MDIEWFPVINLYWALVYEPISESRKECRAKRSGGFLLWQHQALSPTQPLVTQFHWMTGIITISWPCWLHAASYTMDSEWESSISRVLKDKNRTEKDAEEFPVPFLQLQTWFIELSDTVILFLKLLHHTFLFCMFKAFSVIYHKNSVWLYTNTSVFL